MSSTSSVASQPPLPFVPPLDNERAQLARAAADDKAAEKASEKAAKVEDAPASTPRARDDGKGRVVDVRA